MSSYIKSDEQATSDSKNQLKDGKALKTLLFYAKERWQGFSFAIFLMLLGSLASMLSATYMGELVEDGFIPKNYDLSLWISAKVIGIEVIAVLLLWVGRRILSKESMRSLLKMRERCFRKLQELPLTYYDRQPLGRIVTRVTHDIESIEEFFSSSMGRLFQAILTALVVFTTMILTDLHLGLLLTALIIPTVILIAVTKGKIRDLNRKMARLSSRLNSKLSEFISGIDIIRSFGVESWSKKVYDASVDQHLQSQVDSNKFYSTVFPIISFLSTLPIIGLIWFGGERVLAGTLSIGLFVAFIRYAERLNGPIMTVAREIHVVQTAFANLERVSTFLNESTEEETLRKEEPVVGKASPNLLGKITFKNVSMTYDDDFWALNDVSFEISPGEKVGLVGTTGSGKTTTVSLLARLYEYQKGEIFLDDISLRRFDRSFLRSQIGFVGQEAVLFKGSLRDNLTVDPMDDTEIIRACSETGFLHSMNQNALTLDSEILEGGANLSVGERALVSLTRIVLNQPSFMILDEATANVDPGTEKLIHATIDKLMKSRTCLIIAHRLSTLDSCDRLLVFKEGQLVESGSPTELKKSGGVFAGLITAQERSKTQPSKTPDGEANKPHPLI